MTQPTSSQQTLQRAPSAALSAGQHPTWQTVARLGRLLATAALLALLATGCGGYAARVAGMHDALGAGDWDTGLSFIDELIARAEAGKSPEDKDLPLLLLERGALSQAMGDHQSAVADFGHADQMLEILDLTPDKAGKAAEYLWSASKSLYKAPAYEKLMVNMTAITSYLAMGDYNGAAVEARRIGVLNEFYEAGGYGSSELMGTAWYLGGLAMELAGQENEAFGYYDDAWRLTRFDGVAQALVRMGDATGAASEGLDEARALAKGNAVPLAEGESEVVVIALSGRAPRRQAEYLPVGVVFSYFAASQRYGLSAEQQAAYDRMIVEGLLTWVNYPVLVVEPNPLVDLSVQVDGRVASLSRVADMEAFAIAQWEHDRPGIAFSAITRAIVRVLAREAVQAIGREAGGAGQTIGFLAGLATQGAMQAADVPDTRTWSLMPAYISVARVRVPAGPTVVAVEGRGDGLTDRREVSLTTVAGRTHVATVRFFH